MFLIEAKTVGIDEMLVLQTFFKDNIGHGIGQCCISGWFKRKPVIRVGDRCLREPGIHCDDLYTLLFQF